MSRKKAIVKSLRKIPDIRYHKGKILKFSKEYFIDKKTNTENFKENLKIMC